MTPYQQRMASFVRAAKIYGAVSPLFLWWKDVSAIGWLIYVSTLVFLFCLAVGFDAVYDSLVERLPPNRE